jgi:nucleoside-diphosphate-sugar epimerase
MHAEGGSVLVTGGLGCIGAWAVRELLMAGIPAVVLDPSEDTRRLRHVTPPDLFDRVRLVQGDVTNLATIEQVVADHGVAQMIHLAALQIPYCRADPPKGALVNVVGTVNVFEAARRAGIPKVVYTSSIAVFDQEGASVAADATPRPKGHYGVYKLANEGTARSYWNDFGVSSIGVRPMTVYGPGRDRGLTSSPTRAILAAVLGCRYEIGFGGRTLLHYTADTGRALVAAARAPVDGAHLVNLNGVDASISDLISSLLDLIGSPAEGITAKPDALPFPHEVDTTGLDIIGPPSVTPLDAGIAATVRFFEDLQSRGILDPMEHGLVVEGGVAIDRESVPAAQ